MRKYKKPEIQIVNLKSSEDIALTFKDIEGGFIDKYLKNSTGRYAITQYAITNSIYTEAEKQQQKDS